MNEKQSLNALIRRAVRSQRFAKLTTLGNNGATYWIRTSPASLCSLRHCGVSSVRSC